MFEQAEDWCIPHPRVVSIPKSIIWIDIAPKANSVTGIDCVSTETGGFPEVEFKITQVKEE